MNHQVNVAVQVLPKSKVKEPYALVDEAIKVINDSGLRYRVCPFETVIEGPYQDIMSVVEKLQEVCFEKGADEMLVYVKIQNRKDGNVTIEDKMEKYD
ncbi:MAG: MTH1187 family thiamine-binding protein [Bacteroidota bacterium]|nr:MTH1187 family thiamine-binding protein [Bacteroidota bacterium]